MKFVISGDIRLNYLDKSYTITMSIHQMAILFCFEDKDTVMVILTLFFLIFDIIFCILLDERDRWGGRFDWRIADENDEDHNGISSSSAHFWYFLFKCLIRIFIFRENSCNLF